MMNRVLFFFLVVGTVISCLTACGEKPIDNPDEPEATITVKTSVVVEDSLIGHGAQWGGYDLLPEWTEGTFFSDDDWNKLKERVSFMRPGIVRIMIAAGWNYLDDGTYNTAYRPERLLPILDFCQENNISVMFGEWGHEYLNNNNTEIDHEWVGYAAEYLRWLVLDKGYTCIKYYNMVNEPNGNWSTMDGNYTLWKDLVTEFNDSLNNKNMAGKITIAGPDVAVWNSVYTSWLLNTDLDLGNLVGLFDIHTYPGQKEVRDGTYSSLLKAYKAVTPVDKKLIMGELGFKYSAEDGSVYEEELQRRQDDPYCSDIDGNMMVYDAFYGIDIADAILQCMLEGYAGTIVWDMDDAMYNYPEYNKGDRFDVKKLKRWGFWNILGDELFSDGPRGDTDEDLRPWFYPMSLLCRYFPAGMKIYQTVLPDKKGLRVVAGELDRQFTLAIVNSNFSTYENILIEFEDGALLNQMDKYYFKSQSGDQFSGKTNDKGFAIPDSTGLSLDMAKGILLDIEAQSFMLYTNIRY